MGWKGLLCGILALALVVGGCRKKDRDLTTDLHRAADEGDVSQVQMLIARGASVSARDERGRTPLHLAARSGRTEAAEVLVRCGASIDALDDEGRTPAVLAMQERSKAVAQYLVRAGARVDLHLAVYLGDTERVTELIKSGADLNAAGEDGWTPLYYAAEGNHRAIGDLLITAGAEVNTQDREKCTPLHIATEKHCRAMLELLLARGARVDAKDEYGNTPLHLADVHTAKLLIAAGAGLEIRNGSGETPLFLAAESGQTDLAELLIAGGADVDGRIMRTRDNSSRSPLASAVEHGYIDTVRLLVPKVKDINAGSPLHAAITGTFSGAEDRFRREHPAPNATHEEREAAVSRGMDRLRIPVVELLLSHGVNVNGINEDGWTPLHCAAFDGLPEVVELLLEKDADVNAGATYRYRRWDDQEQSFGGITPLHAAAVGGGPRIVELLLAHGAEVNARTESGRTALHYCAAGYEDRWELSRGYHWQWRERWDDGDMVRLLLANGADVNARDREDATPLHYALQNGHGAIAKILVDAGAERVTVRNEGDRRMLYDAFERQDLVLIRLLLLHNADPEEQDHEGNTLLHWAARNQLLELVELLAAHRANVNARNRRGIAPLSYAASGGSAALVSFLLANGAAVNAQSDGGDTALHAAAQHGHLEAVNLLLAHGADFNTKNSRGRTPLDEASRRGHKEIVQLLTADAAGADAGVQDGASRE